jgi:addiction module HigA family antidote
MNSLSARGLPGPRCCVLQRHSLRCKLMTVERIAPARRCKPDIAPVHPGEILKLEFLEPLEQSINALNRVIKAPRSRLNDIGRGRRGSTADTAMRLACHFGVSAQFWMNLASYHERELAKAALGDRLGQEIRPHAAA